MHPEEPPIQNSSPCVDLQIRPVTANESAPSLSKAEAEDFNGSNQSDESSESNGSDGSDMLQEPDTSNESQASDELSADERSEKPWVPPIMTSLDMKFTIDNFAPEPVMSMQEHIMNDEWIAHIYTTFRKTWPSPEDVLNDVDIATTLLSLLVLTTSRKFRLREEWLDVDNLRILAEQELVRKSLACVVRQKRFAILRTLRIWYR